MARILVTLLAALILSCPAAAIAADPQPGKDTAVVRGEMQSAYRALKDLQPFLASRERFTAEENEKEIAGLIRQLRSTFHHVDAKQPQATTEPGFVSTLNVLNELLQDAEARFGEGKKGYAQWRLRTASNHCIACHTRFEIPMQFSVADASINELSAFDQGQFFLATRQFDRAEKAFKQAATQRDDNPRRMEALRQWLLVYTRVKPDPDEALTELTRMLSRTPLRAFDQQEVQGWIASLRRWKSESPAKDIPPLTRAENLIRQALGAGDVITGQRGTVELLRATAILHSLLDSRDPGLAERRAHMLYLLGLSYSNLPYFFIDELPDMFLEQAIRERPDSETARKAFRRYEEIVTQSFTGSGGTHLPSDVKLKMDELHDLAFGVKELREAV